MKFSDLFPSKYLKAGDLENERKTVTIKCVELENPHGEQPKAVVYFKEEVKGLVLNRTNSNTLRALYGDETDAWASKEIVLVPTESDYQGKRVPCVRLASPKPQLGLVDEASPNA